MTDYKAMIEEHSCKPNQGCGVMTICMCGVAEDMADEIERLRGVIWNAAFALHNAGLFEDAEKTKAAARAALGEKE